MGERVSLDTRYISHGEIQQSLSLDGKQWAPNAVELIARECAAIADDPGVSLAAAYDGAGALQGAAIAVWELEAPNPHVVIADLVVDPNARSGGVGRALVAFVEAEARARGIGWAFLESGLGNERAHHFFEREGFAVVSKVFAKRL
ncbi:MAG TPA: GNAT family N-acetyltransferase [Terricaulis sp.]|nr:GNAT family N-acetyltransferase [Terricaulis sp.]